MKFLPKFSVQNPVLVGVLMASLLIGGVYGAVTLVREMFPESRPDQVMIQTIYPGASPQEVEKGVAMRLEEAIKDVDDIEKIETSITEGSCTIMVEMTSDVDDIDQAVTDLKSAVDSIPSDELPDDAEETRVTKFEPLLPVISVAVYGDLDEQTLKDYSRKLRDDLLLLPEISKVVIGGMRKAELTVEVLPEKMVAYNVSLAEVSAAIGQSNLDLPGGQVKTEAQNVAVRTLGETDQASAIADTIVKTTAGGQIVRVRDLGRVVDGFEDADLRGRYNGRRAVDVTIYKTGDQDAVSISNQVKAFVAGKSSRTDVQWDWLTRLRNVFGVQTEPQRIYERALRDPYPSGVLLDTHSNLAKYIESRLELLTRNGFWGLLLVFASLLLFLNWRVAFWVLMGLIVSVCGAIVMMHIVGATLNLISMFGLIVVLGIIVDDAIVVGENIYARFEHGDDPEHAAVAGAQQVTWPVIVAVLTTIGAFVPLMFIEGRMGQFMGVLPVVVTCALSISLLEALVILPSHLNESLHKLRRRRQAKHAAQPDAPAGRFRAWEANLLGRHLLPAYERVLRGATSYRYLTIACAVSLLIFSLGLVASGRVPFVFMQKMDSETILANVELPVGAPAEQTEEALRVVEHAASLLFDTGEMKTIYSLVGAQLNLGTGGASLASRSHLGQVIMELSDVENRDRTSEEIIAELRERTADTPGVNSLQFKPMGGGPGGSELELEITSEDLDAVVEVAEQIKKQLATFDGVFDIADDFEAGRREVQLELLDSARPLGLTTRALATEVRGAFFGLEARTLQREREDVDIRVRFAEDRRRTIHDLESMRIKTPTGQMIPLVEAARITEGRGYSTIRRVDQRRAVTVSADVDQAVNNAEAIITELTPIMANIETQHPGMRIDFTGNKRETARSFGSLKRDFLIALLVIYVMLAGLFKSYTQPLVVLTAVPFGLIGAIAGHFLMGYPMTLLSMIGAVALTGIVVNDSLILVDFINHEIGEGRNAYESVILGGRRRLRAIILTSLTTIVGLAPLMLETSFQARFLIPMAISISFGLGFATVLTLVVVPCIYLAMLDAKTIVERIKGQPALAAALD